MRRRHQSGKRGVKRGPWNCRLEMLEARLLFSVTKELGVPLGWDGSAGAANDSRLGFDQDTTAYQAAASGPLADATPTGSSYRLFENWGGIWWDAEKTVANTEDDLMCWAAAASNVLAWTGWGTETLTTADQIFGYFQSHWNDEGGLMEFGWDWWFDGSNSRQGWQGWSQVDVAGGGFYPSESLLSYFHSESNTAMALSAIDNYLHSGYGVTLGIYGPGGHAITCWGYNYDTANPSNYLGLWITDSDDDKGSNTPPDRLHYYEVASIDGKWYLQDYYGSNEWYIGAVQALAPRDAVPQGNVIRGTVATDQNGDGQRQESEAGLASEVIYLDANHNGQFDSSRLTFASTDAPKAIPDNGTVSSILTVSGAATISDLNVRLNIAHTYDEDLVAYLISPTGTRVQLFSHVGGSGDGFANTTLDDEAALNIGSGTAPFSGTFKPQDLLSRFDGENPNGVWTLEVSDTMGYDVGTLNSWSLEIESGERYTETGADGSYAFLGLAEGSYDVRHAVREGWTDTYPAAAGYAVNLSGQAVENLDFLTMPSAEAPAVINLGPVDYTWVGDQNPSAGDLWYSLETTHAGYLTVEALFSESSGSVELSLYDPNMNLLNTSLLSDGGERIDAVVSAGSQYFLKLSGSVSDVDLRLTNLVSLEQGVVTVIGTSGEDRFDFAVAGWHQVTVNDVEYAFDSGTVTSVVFNGSGGDDTAVLCTSTGDDTATFRPGILNLVGTDYSATVHDVASIIVINAGGIDIAHLYDSAGNETVNGGPTYLEMLGEGFYNRVEGFAYAHAYGTTGGTDIAHFFDSAGNDTFNARSDYSTLSGEGFFLRAKRFDAVHAYGTAGGTDVANLFDSSGNDSFVGTSEYARMNGAGFVTRAKYFEQVVAYSTAGGTDAARLYDTAGNDTFSASPREATLQTATYRQRVLRFEAVTAYATSGGTDIAELYDSSGADTFHAYPTVATLSGSGYTNQVRSFDIVHAYANAGGVDNAYLYGSAGNDTFTAYPTWAKLTGANYFNRAKYFDQVYAYAGVGGTDRAYLYDGTGADNLNVAGSRARLTYAGAGLVQAETFTWARAYGNAGGQNTKHVESHDFALETTGTWTNV